MDENTKNKGVDYPYIKGIPETTSVVLYQCNTDPLQHQLFGHELEALEQANSWDISSHFPDKFIIACIFARKFDMNRVKEMLEGCHTYRQSFGYLEWPLYDSIEKILLFNSSYFSVPGARTRDGCGIIYMRIKHMVTADDVDFDHAEAMLRMMFWNFAVGMFIDGLDIHRNGFYIVEDLKGLGWKHIDVKMQKKMSKMNDHFPMRLKKVIILNPPGIMKAIMVILKPFIQKKLLKRMKQISDLDALQEWIEPDQLFTEYGGTLEYDPAQHQTLFEQFIASEEQNLFQ